MTGKVVRTATCLLFFFQVTQSQELTPQKQSIVVVGIPTDGIAPEPGENGFALSGANLENLSSVLADDPLRAVAATPGVTSNDDFSTTFAIRGADPARVGIYLDGVPLHNALHNLEGTDLLGSTSVFNPALIQSLNVVTSGASPAYWFGSAGVVNFTSRDGDAHAFHYGASLGFGEAGFNATGPIGRHDRCAFIAGVRKSFLNYLLGNQGGDASMIFGITDEQERLTCHASDEHTFTFETIESSTDLNTGTKAIPPDGTLGTVHQRAETAIAGWVYSPNPAMQLRTRLAWSLDLFKDQSEANTPFDRGRYQDWTAMTDAAVTLNPSNTLTAGASFRRSSTSAFYSRYVRPTNTLDVDTSNGSAVEGGAYVDDAVRLASGRIRLSAGAREDYLSLDGESVLSPRGSAAIRLPSNLELQLSAGQFSQFPDITQLGSSLGSPLLLPSRSLQTNVALARWFGSKVEARVELYNRQDRDLVNQPYGQARLMDGSVFNAPDQPLLMNSLRGSAHGVEAYVFFRELRRFTASFSYAYGHATSRDGLTQAAYPSDFDQTHTANAFISRPLKRGITVSARWSYGSGYPIPGFVAYNSEGTMNGTAFVLSEYKNRLRLPAYSRLDLRVNKTWGSERSRARKTLYFELLNATNHQNERFGSFDDNYGRFAYLSVDQMFPLLPTAGFVYQR